MKNRITHILKDWKPEVPAAESTPEPRGEVARGAYPLPRGINMLMPVELCINRDLLIRHKQAHPSPMSDQAMAELEAALQQQLAFRAWAREHPASYICIAMYPTTKPTRWRTWGFLVACQQAHP